MGQFPDGMGTLEYKDKYCLDCVHWDRSTHPGEPPEPTDGCDIWDAHMALDIDAVDRMGRECHGDARLMLDRLIPVRDGVNQECRMFIKKVTT